MVEGLYELGKEVPEFNKQELEKQIVKNGGQRWQDPQQGEDSFVICSRLDCGSALAVEVCMRVALMLVYCSYAYQEHREEEVRCNSSSMAHQLHRGQEAASTPARVSRSHLWLSTNIDIEHILSRYYVHLTEATALTLPEDPASDEEALPMPPISTSREALFKSESHRSTSPEERRAAKKGRKNGGRAEPAKSVKREESDESEGDETEASTASDSDEPEGPFGVVRAAFLLPLVCARLTYFSAEGSATFSYAER